MEPATGLEQFFDAAERLVADHGADPATFARIGNLLRIVAADGTLIDESRLDALHQSSAQATILGHGPTGSTLTAGAFGRMRNSCVHRNDPSNSSWLCPSRFSSFGSLSVRGPSGTRRSDFHSIFARFASLCPGASRVAGYVCHPAVTNP